jgi:hypothetical protein
MLLNDLFKCSLNKYLARPVFAKLWYLWKAYELENAVQHASAELCSVSGSFGGAATQVIRAQQSPQLLDISLQSVVMRVLDLSRECCYAVCRNGVMTVESRLWHC